MMDNILNKMPNINLRFIILGIILLSALLIGGSLLFSFFNRSAPQVSENQKSDQKIEMVKGGPKAADSFPLEPVAPPKK